MKKRGKKLLSLLLGTAMAVSVLAGCGSSKADTTVKEDTATAESSASSDSASTEEVAAADTSEHVDLTMYLLGDRTPDFDEVYGKINEILEEKLNCSLNVEFLSWGEHDTKYSLLFSAQEDFDLI